MNMTAYSPVSNPPKHDLFRTISLTSLVSGSMHLGALLITQFLLAGKDPATFLKFVASGVFGKEAMEGGRLMIAWGLVFHFAIVFVFTSLLFLLFPIARRIVNLNLVLGVVYGIFTWAIMYCLVLPLSAIHYVPGDLASMFLDASFVILLIGLPVAAIAGKFYYFRKEAGNAS
jgi:hypothetical protein